MDGATRTKSDGLRKQEYREEYPKVIESGTLEEEKISIIEQSWEQEKQTVVGSARKVCGFLMVKEKLSQRMSELIMRLKVQKREKKLYISVCQEQVRY